MNTVRVAAVIKSECAAMDQGTTVGALRAANASRVTLESKYLRQK